MALMTGGAFIAFALLAIALYLSGKRELQERSQAQSAETPEEDPRP